MPKINLKEKKELQKTYNPAGEEKNLQEFLSSRVEVLKEYRKKELPNGGRNIEAIWKEADKEYTPHELGFGSGKKRLESIDDKLGFRSKFVEIGSDNWQSNGASPDFYVKIQTALSILVDQNPEAVFMPSASKYEANTLLAYNNWKNSWEISGAKQQMKNFIFNQAKYGTAYGRTYPKIIEINKRIRTEYFPNEPEKDVYKEKRLVKYNDLCRESLNPWGVWLSPMARVGDIFSVDDWYFEKDFSWDKFQETFKDYSNIQYTKKGLKEGENKEDDIITVGFYENQVKDIYAIWIPSAKIVLYYSPLPNDDGKLSLWFSPWTLRDDRIHFGIGIYEIIRNDSILYDKMANMTMDQLTLSLYKMFFYKGTDVLGENGQIKVAPGVGQQVTDPKSVTFLEVPGPGNEAWAGLQYLADQKDKNSGINQQLSAKFSGKTLGQDLEAKEAALERMKTPLDYILDALQNEAYISLSWQKQILSTPEILEYSNPGELQAVLMEAGLEDNEIQRYLEEAQNPETELLYQEETGVDENGEPIMVNKANVYPESKYGLEQDDKGELIETDKTKFYRFGLDLPLGRLEWNGVIRIKPQSVLQPSKELSKSKKLDMFNLVYPAIQGMLAQPMNIPALLPPIKEIIKVYDEDVKDWIDEKFFEELKQMASQPVEEDKEKVSLSVKWEQLPTDVQAQLLEKYFDVKVKQPLFVGETPTAPVEEGGEQFKPITARGNIKSGNTEAGAIAGANNLKT